jgi:hypothetical protein
VFPVSIKIDDIFTLTNADPSINCTFRGRTIDSSDEYENASRSIRVNLESDSNAIDESDFLNLQLVKVPASSDRGTQIRPPAEPLCDQQRNT